MDYGGGAGYVGGASVGERRWGDDDNDDENDEDDVHVGTKG